MQATAAGCAGAARSAGFVPRDAIPFAADLEREARAIAEEASRLAPDDYSEWPEKGAAYDGGWRVFPILLRYAHPLAEALLRPENVRRCPRTYEIVSSLPDAALAGFSMLEAGTRIRPHSDFAPDGVIRCHLALRIPAGCGIRVENETREWREGELLAFPACAEHEAWNGSAERRVVLVVDYLPRR
ncbi:MAG TPA: aspartyl/asparaginyl beta-hydroxylase domain-containing protein [Planctomycetota bacterium]|nr:aspartyl/asparaginyl beta-hydroxylase domain-containing protein [Planctomycetota bacterium]